MHVTLYCPSCSAALPVAAADAPERIRCGRCGRELGLDWTPAVRRDEAVDRCPLCRGTEVYGRKDFNPRTGLTVVIAGALISAAFYWYGQDLVAYGILAGAALIDLMVYQWLGEVTVCYRCHAEFRGRYPRSAPAFDLHTADVLEAEWRRAQSSVGSGFSRTEQHSES